MADKVEKPKKKTAKPKSAEKGVMAALPSTRPERIGAQRTAAGSPAPKTTTPTAASKTAAQTSAEDKPAPAAKAKHAPAAKRKAAPKATAARRKAAAPRTFEPTRAAEAAAGAADERAAGAVPLADTPPVPRDPATSYPRRPRAVREGAPGIGTAGYRKQPSPEHGGRHAGGLVGTAVRAAGEVTQVGLGLGGRVLKRAAGRLPRP
jgi:hypothetical protein